jgi:hypothetical protein
MSNFVLILVILSCIATNATRAEFQVPPTHPSAGSDQFWAFGQMLNMQLEPDVYFDVVIFFLSAGNDRA